MAGNDVEIKITARDDTATGFAGATARTLAFTKLISDQGSAAVKSAGGFAALGGATGMGAAVIAGVALAPVIATVGVGLAGLGIAALGAGKNSNLFKQSLAQAKPELLAFQKSLQPEILGVFNEGIKLAGTLLRGVQPVAAATGNALAGVLAQVNAEFRSGEWQQFFGFMAQQAGPDVRLLGDTFKELLGSLPTLAMDLQPVARGLLVVADDAAHAVHGLAGLWAAGQRDFPLSTQHTFNALRELDHWVVSVTDHLGPWARAINNAGTGAQQMIDGTAGAGKALDVTGREALTAAGQLQAVATAVKSINTAEASILTFQNNYASALVTAATDARALELALDKSKGKIGLQTAAQIASFGVANTYINNLSGIANAAGDSAKGQDRAIAALSRGLPILESATGKTSAYWVQVKTLVGWLHTLEVMKAIRETVFVTGSGTFTVRPGTGAGLPGGSAGGPFGKAAGGIVSGGVPGKDSVLASLMPGEVIVPTHMVASGAVDHLRGRLPGFAAGGLVGSYAGPVAGLVPWGTQNLNATVSIMEQAVAKATLAGMRAAAQSFSGAGGAGGPGGGAPAANAALARSMFPQWSTGPLWAAWNYVAMRESGWNQFARNPSSGAYGIPQALPPTKMPFAAQAAGGSNPRAQIGWMASYMSQRYGGPIGAAQHEAAFNWYDSPAGNWLSPGPNLMWNGTGRSEHVAPTSGGGTTTWEIVPGAGGAVEQFLAEILRKFIRVRGGNVQQVLGR